MRFFEDYDIEQDDEMPDEELIREIDPTFMLDDPEYIDDENDDDDFEEDETPLRRSQPKTIVGALRDELKVIEPDRGSLRFRHGGVEYEGVPMLEINPNKFVFKLLPSDKLKMFTISEIQVV